jgi:DNA-binding PadR family transcriptional regulator
MYSKELLKGTLQPIILSLLSQEDKMYGYEIFTKVKELSEGKILLKDGSLYPVLQKMQKERILEVEEVFIGKRVRKYYSLTAQGVKVKMDYLTELKEFMATLDQIVFKTAQIV